MKMHRYLLHDLARPPVSGVLLPPVMKEADTLTHRSQPLAARTGGSYGETRDPLVRFEGRSAKTRQSDFSSYSSIKAKVTAVRTTAVQTLQQR